jgi:hypothetical protein
MAEEFEVTWEGELPASPREVCDAFTRRTAGCLWEIEYEPRAGGAERQAPEASARDGFAAVRRALKVTAGVAVGDRVRLEPAGTEGVVDYATSAFLGVRGADALYRFYGRDRWDWPVAVAVHRFGGGADEAAPAGGAWLHDVFSTEAVA